MKLCFLWNGCWDKKYTVDFFRKYDKIVCVDGGYNSFKELNTEIEPDYLIGDLDSVDEKWKDEIGKMSKDKVIYKDNQDETDFAFAVNYILKKYNNITEIDIIYFSSQSRLDHLLCNIIFIKQIPKNIYTRMITDKQELYLLRDKISILNKKGKELTLLPLTNVKGVTSHGWKWEVASIDWYFGFVGGISNVIWNDEVDISLNEGELLIICEI